MKNLSDLTPNNFEAIFLAIVDGLWSKEQIKDFLLSLNNFGFTSDAFKAAVKVLKARCHSIRAPEGAIDVCGTGGDKLNTLNVSTAVAFIVAGCGVPVAKHGNRAISSKSGSADVLAELGVDIMADPSAIEVSLFENNLCFMFAPIYHSSLKSLGEIRKEVGVATIFNFLGPLLNPANTRYQLIGTSKRETMLPMAITLNDLGSKKVFLVNGFDGMDEITISNNSFLIKIIDGKIGHEELINPEEFGFQKVALGQIQGGNARYNAQKLLALLDGEKSAYLDIALINAAFALLVANQVNSVGEGVELARESIASGKAKKVLTKISNLFKN